MQAPRPAPAIEVRDLTLSFSTLEKPVLRGISLTIEAGEIIIMTGPSGSGKSTFLTIVGALRHATSGYVHVLGHDLSVASIATSLEVRRKSGYIFQQHNLLDSLTAVQNVCMALELRGGSSEEERREKSLIMLDRVGLRAHAHKRPHELSGGQRQRVSIARALVAHPKLVLADEPTASLDKVSGHECVEILKNLAMENHTTILLVTHDHRILDMASRIVHLEDGMLTDR